MASGAGHSNVADTQRPGPRLNIKTAFPRYGKEKKVKEKKVAKLSYLEHGDPYTGKKTFLYWDGPGIHAFRFANDITKCIFMYGNFIEICSQGSN